MLLTIYQPCDLQQVQKHLLQLQVGRDQLVALGQCIGKITHGGKFRLTIGALDLLSAHARHKVQPLALVIVQSAVEHQICSSDPGMRIISSACLTHTWRAPQLFIFPLRVCS